jgi:hypothetical protein
MIDGGQAIRVRQAICVRWSRSLGDFLTKSTRT